MLDLSLSFGRCWLQSPGWWIAIASWGLAWCAVRFMAPILLISVTSDLPVTFYNLLYLSALASGALTLVSFERFESLLRRGPGRWTVALVLLAVFANLGVMLVTSLLALEFDIDALAGAPTECHLHAGWLVVITGLTVAAIALARQLRGFRIALFVVALVGLTASQPDITAVGAVHGNFELVSRALPILGMSSIVALIERRAGSPQ